MSDTKVSRKSAIAIVIDALRTDTSIEDVIADNEYEFTKDDVIDTLVKMHKSIVNAKHGSGPSKSTLENKAFIENTLIPYVADNQPVRAKMLVNDMENINTPQKAGAILRRATEMGLLSANPYNEKGSRSYALPDYNWGE